jgi:hypothetical protein
VLCRARERVRFLVLSCVHHACVERNCLSKV